MSSGIPADEMVNSFDKEFDTEDVVVAWTKNQPGLRGDK